MLLLILISNLMVDSLMDDPVLKSAQFGICVYDLDNDTLIYSRNDDKLLVPASNLKIVTTSASLYLLGPDCRFTTRLLRAGSEENGIIEGDIILVGGGDPTFGVDQIQRFIDVLQRKKIRSITGNVLVDDSYFTDLSLQGNSFTFERLPVGWSWHYLDARYAAEVSALTFNENSIGVAIRHTKGDSAVLVSLLPETGYVRLVSRMVVKEGEDSIIIYRRPENNVIYVSGGVGSGRKKDIPVAVKDPAFFAGYYFMECLERNGIDVGGTVMRRINDAKGKNGDFVVIDSVLSPPLVDILRETNVESVNLYAETLLKILGARFYNEGTFNKGLIMVRSFLDHCGVDTSNVSLWDGSGLSRYDLITPLNIVQVLRFMYRSVYRDIFLGLLPMVGEGTLEYRFKDFDGILRAKTGSIHAVSCLSGYLTVNEHNYCFSLMFNNFANSRRKIDDIQEKIILELNDYLGAGER